MRLAETRCLESFLNITGEVRSILFLAKDLKYIDDIRVDGLLSDRISLSKDIGKSIRFLSRKTDHLQTATNNP